MEKMEPTGSGTIKGVHSPGNVERLFEFKPPGFSWRVGEKQDDIFGILLSPLASVIPKFKIRSSSPAFCKSTLNFGTLDSPTAAASRWAFIFSSRFTWPDCGPADIEPASDRRLASKAIDKFWWPLFGKFT
jgi:hypothetical protein